MVGDSLMRSIRKSSQVVEILAGLEFDVTRTDPGEEVRLASGAPLEVIAGDFSGGTYFLCGKDGQRPVLYASSEGQAGLIGLDLAAALEVLVGLPYWMDCLKFSGGGRLEEMRAAQTVLLTLGSARDFPDLEEDRARLRAVVGVEVKPAAELLAALHAAVERTEPDFVLLGPEGDAYESLFNTFRVSENQWLQQRLQA